MNKKTYLCVDKILQILIPKPSSCEIVTAFLFDWYKKKTHGT